MKRVYGYIRVSTVKQGTGVSLQEQKDAIIRYAEKHDLIIVEWFEEQETAAKQGRPLFTRMMKLLQIGKAQGVVIHKIDRSARNLKDWASLGDLIDKGVDVHFAHESLDLDTRGGRLAADIQAVIASDYIRNLRDETRKGIYGRLKQGMFPFSAPIGYLNNGPGQLKTIDPIQGPLVKKAFELYGTGTYNLERLTNEMRERGLKNSIGGFVSLTTLAKVLNNTFYVGVLEVKGKNFQGKHELLIPTGLFFKVRDILRGKTNTRPISHTFLFRRLVKCSECGYSLIGEKQKTFIYYRCHTKECPTKGIREDFLEKAIIGCLDQVRFHPVEDQILHELLKESQENWAEEEDKFEKSLKMQQTGLEQKLSRLTDAYIDGVIDNVLFEEKKAKLFIEMQALMAKANNAGKRKEVFFRKAEKYLELVKSLKKSYITGEIDEKRGIVKMVTSNFSIQRKKPIIAMKSPFQEIANRLFFSPGGPSRRIPRNCTPEIANSDNFSREVVDSEELRSSMKELLNSILKSFEGNLMGNEEE